MIRIYEGLGGWTIRVINNGYEQKSFECSQYIVKRCGINWFDFDAAMKDAEKLDKKQQASTHAAS